MLQLAFVQLRKNYQYPSVTMSGAHMVTEDLKTHQMWFLLPKPFQLQKDFSHLDTALAIRSLILPIKLVILHNCDNFACISLPCYYQSKNSEFAEILF